MRKKNKTVLLLLLFCGLLAAGCGKEGSGDSSEGASVENEDVKVVSQSDEAEDADTDLKAEQETMEEEPQKKGILIALDPGHQGWNVDMSAPEANAPGSDVMKARATSGTSGRFSGIPEYQLNLDISLLVRDRLIEQGYDVIMTREDNETAISNAERAMLANEAGADISVRIHANGSESLSANGALVLVASAQNPYVGSLYDSSYRLGELVLNAYCDATGMQNLGIQTNDTMTGINWSQIPVIILEMGFMTNEQDDLNMADADYRMRMADGIVNGINAYYGY